MYYNWTVSSFFIPGFNGSGPYLFGQVVHLKNQDIINIYKLAIGTKFNNIIHGFLSKSLSLFTHNAIDTHINNGIKITIEYKLIFGFIDHNIQIIILTHTTANI